MNAVIFEQGNVLQEEGLAKWSVNSDILDGWIKHNAEFDVSMNLCVDPDKIPPKLMDQMWHLLPNFNNRFGATYNADTMTIDIVDMVSVDRAMKKCRYLQLLLTGVAMGQDFARPSIPWNAESIQSWYRWCIMVLWDEGENDTARSN